MVVGCVRVILWRDVCRVGDPNQMDGGVEWCYTMSQSEDFLRLGM